MNVVSEEENIYPVLIIDDEIDLCCLLQDICRKKGLKARSANNLKEAGKELARDPRLIFLDNNLPDGLGLEFIPTIRGRSQNSCIIMISAENTGGLKEKAFRLGVNYFLSKPFDFTDVSHLIDKLASQPIN